MAICIRCGGSSASRFADYCFPCGEKTRGEVARGLRRLERYLAAWAAFEEWSGGRRSDGASRDASPDHEERERSRPSGEAPAIADYFPTGYSILSGSLADGSLASLRGLGERLAVAAKRRGRSYVVEFAAYASIEPAGASARGLGVEVRGDATPPGIALALHLYNWRTKSWEALEVLCVPGDRGSVLAAAVQLTDFVSLTGEVCLGVRAESSRSFQTRTGRVLFTVES